LFTKFFAHDFYGYGYDLADIVFTIADGDSEIKTNDEDDQPEEIPPTHQDTIP
jgi:hypothetical protein